MAVAGDLVGGWENHVSLHRCNDPEGCKGETSHGNFFLTLTGLKPGVYFYKFIVDGTWTVDPSAPKVRSRMCNCHSDPGSDSSTLSRCPKVIDSAGNYNNVLNVPSLPLSITSKERLQVVRWQAGCMALELKMRGS